MVACSEANDRVRKSRILSAFLAASLLAFSSWATARDACNCKGYAGPGGPCYAGPGGAAYDGPGGPAYAGPGGSCYAGPGPRAVR
jgi:hypothetical protein